jgi:amidase
MANSLSGVEVFMKAVIGAKPWNIDPLAIRKPWDMEEYDLSEHGGASHEKKLAFAIMWDNDVVRPHPPLVRAMKMTKAALEARGHTGQLSSHSFISRADKQILIVVLTVIDWVPHRHLEIYKNAVSNHLKNSHAAGKTCIILGNHFRCGRKP